MKEEMTVFMIDDDAEDQEIFSDALKSMYPSVKCVNFFNGMQVLKNLSSEGATLPDFIFTDYNMPIMNGYELLKELKQDDHLKDIPVIIYTTSSPREQQEEAVRLGATSVFIKPSTMTELKKMLDDILSKA